MFRKLQRKDYYSFAPLVKHEYSSDLTRGEYNSFLNSLQDNHEIWVMYNVEDRIIASGSILFETKLNPKQCMFAHVQDILIANGHQPEKMGKEICTFLLQYAKHKGCSKTFLNCPKDYISFFEKRTVNEKNRQFVYYY